MRWLAEGSVAALTGALREVAPELTGYPIVIPGKSARPSVDIAAFPERIFGPEHVIRHPDGSADFVGITESMSRDLDRRVLHRATCETLGDHDDHYQMICGTRAELEDIMADYDTLCPACL